MAIVNMPTYRQLFDFLSLASIAISMAKTERERRRSDGWVASTPDRQHMTGALDPKVASSLHGGGLAKLGEADIAAAKAIEEGLIVSAPGS
jgi:hypothetical protein